MAPKNARNLPRSLDITRGLDPRLGGLSVAVPALVKYTGETDRFGADLAVFRPMADRGHPEQTGLRPSQVHEIRWDPFSPSRMISAYKKLDILVRSHDVLQIHGIWESHSTMAAHLAHTRNKPYVVSAHGMLDSWAMRYRHWRKTVYMALAEKRNLQHACCLRALTSAEVGNYRSLGLRTPVAVIPNGVTIPAHLSPDAFLERWPKLKGKRIVLFLSRIHAKKGVDILCRAWKSVSRSSDDLHLVIAGPDYENTQVHIEKFVTDEGLTRSVTFTGMLDSDMKWSALSASTVFVLPSWSEGFSVAILEALAASKLIIITRQCNFPELENREFATLIEPDECQLQEALKSALSLSDPVRLRQGQAALEYVERHYSWPAIGNKMADLFQWMLDGKMPASVDLVLS